jgi:integrase
VTAVLTDAFLRALKPPTAGRVELRDAKVHGLVVRVAASGAVSFAARGRRPDGREVRVTLGEWPTLSLKQARDDARATLVDLRKGGDPVAEKRALRAARKVREAAPTVGERLSEWQRAHERRWSTRYATEVKRICDREVVRVLGRMALREVDREAWTGCIAAVAERTPGQGAFLYRTCASFLAHADAHGWIDMHPLPRRGASRIAPAVKPRERIPSNDELVAILRAADTLTAKPRVFVWLLATTGARLNEVAGIAVGEIDFARGLWQLPAERAKNGRSYMMPVPTAVLKELRELVPDGAGNRYRLLGAVPGGALSGFSKLKRLLDERSRVSGWRFHDLRRVVRSGLSALGVANDVAELCLNHTLPGGALRSIYDRHDYGLQVLEALRRWQARVAELMTPEPRGAVIPLRQRPVGVA